MATPNLSEEGMPLEVSYLESSPQDHRPQRLSRSPHPYHRRGPNLSTLETESVTDGSSYIPTPSRQISQRATSDSGTEADDESTGFLKGLPAPPARPRKGLRTPPWNGSEIGVELTTSRGWSAFRRRRRRSQSPRKLSTDGTDNDDVGSREQQLSRKNRIEILRRVCETALVLAIGVTVFFGNHVAGVVRAWKLELYTFAAIVLALYSIYPIRISLSRGYRHLSWRAVASIPFSSGLDPAPLIYPILLPLFIALSLAIPNHILILLNIILSISSLPSEVIPFHDANHGYSAVHWIIAVIPAIVSEYDLDSTGPERALALLEIDPEVLILLFPLQQTLLSTLDFLVTTSLLPTELQLLATGLINVLFFSRSPQAEILKALIWLGGVSMFVLCRNVLGWELALARVPSWKFRRSPGGGSRPWRLFKKLDHEICHKLTQVGAPEFQSSDSDTVNGALITRRRPEVTIRRNTQNIPTPDGKVDGDISLVHPASAIDNVDVDSLFLVGEDQRPGFARRRRHTLATMDDVRTTRRGRRKRLMGPGLQSFLSLTAAQAQVRKWAYALYVYVAVVFIIFVPIRMYVGEYALHGNEPTGWAVGYIFGNIPSFRFWVVKTNLENWIRIPPLPETGTRACHLGWVEHFRQDYFGEAHTRLIICAYCLLVILVGITLVLRLSTVVEVDTCRKVFHGMMVAMFLPTAFIDPLFASLALILTLATFLILDLFRASQLPPISKPLTYFLAPYVDGRDHKGPVIVSHVFLLIGCAIPLWLSLASLPRTGTPPWEGWEVPTRDISMVSGVICVGMGDAAASLVGRRLGRNKWFWGGGKSLEGSAAFAVAVFLGLIMARIWLVLGGWDRSVSLWSITQGIIILVKSAIAASASSLTEAVLTGGNDNVVVPLVLWLLVRGLRI
ncbi:hypothetical protein AJ80_00247 [Polytolypa hystricis UAMH7299]|uniref:dolichol kinase n=1 Tax=Polytolypa hystricis (strain UAMH7299) TaxID=1447883 RepID=A0A2B7Z4M3_POLH7|nr:hypothetical protein AJ80_00247 [Polytolypa hystricis UAMH7299]